MGVDTSFSGDASLTRRIYRRLQDIYRFTLSLESYGQHKPGNGPLVWILLSPKSVSDLVLP